MCFGKRELEGHLGFAVALEMLNGMNLFWHLGLFWTRFLAGSLFLYTNRNSTDVRVVCIWKTERKMAIHLFTLTKGWPQRGRDGQKVEMRGCQWDSSLRSFLCAWSTFIHSTNSYPVPTMCPKLLLVLGIQQRKRQSCSHGDDMPWNRPAINTQTCAGEELVWRSLHQSRVIENDRQEVFQKGPFDRTFEQKHRCIHWIKMSLQLEHSLWKEQGLIIMQSINIS